VPMSMLPLNKRRMQAMVVQKLSAKPIRTKMKMRNRSSKTKKRRLKPPTRSITLIKYLLTKRLVLKSKSIRLRSRNLQNKFAPRPSLSPTNNPSSKKRTRHPANSRSVQLLPL